MTPDAHDVVVVGRRLAAHLHGAGVTGALVLDEVLGSVFDDATNTWTLTTREGWTCRGRVVVAGSPLTPWIPPVNGRDDFGGPAFHSAAPDPGFDPAGRHLAVLGPDSGAGHYLERVARSAASVTVFALPPRRVVSLPRAGVRRWRRPASPRVVTAPIDTLTASGVRTRDGAHYDVEAIVFGTGFAVADRDQGPVGARGLTWHDGMEPYLGVAVHGLPNYFFIGGPDAGARARRVAECLALMSRGGRIEVRRSSQQTFNERVHLRGPQVRPTTSAFDLSWPGTTPEDVYDGAATLTVGEGRHRIRVRLTGHMDPIDGHYHWRGTVFDRLPDDVLRQSQSVALTVGDRTAPARITEQTPQGTHSIAGVGTPPFVLDDITLSVPAASC